MSRVEARGSAREPSNAPRYVVGIDLGTTHTVVGFVDTARPHDAPGGTLTGQARPRIEVFPVPQLVAKGEVMAQPLLPSFRFHPTAEELSESDRALFPGAAVEGAPEAIVGSWAQQLGRQVPGRLVSSAKSWLCHAAVDRSAPILPWGAAEGVSKISPVAASASYLAHVRATWDAAHPRHPLAQQDVVLTVPASFDEAARALTLEAAVLAGLPKVRLLEEPQAAFYDYLDRHRDTLEADLAQVKLVLVVDVGGGTTDLTLIQVELRESGPRLTRIAVGDHLMLGGDNMDHTLARLIEPELLGPGQTLSGARFSQLVQQCRLAKEKLLGAEAPEQVSVTLLGGSSKLIGGTKSAPLERAAVERLVIDGFFPEVDLAARPDTRKSGLIEFGLPYTADAAITKHIAAFLARHRGVVAEVQGVSAAELDTSPARAVPDAILFNGGVFRGAALRTRLREVLDRMRGEPVHELDNEEPELSVARGAVAYGLARRGMGLRIGGGSARSYYLLLEGDQGQTGLCVLPRGAEEGEELTLSRTFALRVGAPVRFRLFSSTSEKAHRPSELVPLGVEARGQTDYHELPEIAVVLEGRPGEKELEVGLHAALTEVGTLEMSAVANDDPKRRYRLEFALRGEHVSEGRPSRVTQLHARFAEAVELIHAYYGKSNKELEGRKIKTLRQDLEKILGEREGWDSALSRELFGALLAGQKRRRRSADHERLWLHLTGYCLRPGYGYPVDAYRVEQVWGLFPEGIQFAPEAQVWSQWWILWRRIAGGLDENKQRTLFQELAYYLEPQGPRPKARPKGPKAQGIDDMVRLAGTLERLPREQKVELGAWLLAGLERQQFAAPSVYWSLGRLGARAPLYGSVHTVVPRTVAESWLERVLRLDLHAVEHAALCVAQLARLTQDRERDLDPTLRERAAAALSRSKSHEGWLRLVRDGGELTAADEGRVFGESLPVGLRLIT